MERKRLLLVLISAALLTAPPLVAMGLQRSTPDPATVDATTSGLPSSVAQAGLLNLGDRFEGEFFDLEVQSAYTADSMTRRRYTEVRVSVAYRNNRDTAIPFSNVALSGEFGYPTLRLVDGAGVTHGIDLTITQHTSVAGSNLLNLPPDVPARWTVGFQVPSTQDQAMTVEAVWQGGVIGRWDLHTEPRPLQGWDAPRGISVVSFGEKIAWSEDVDMVAEATTTAACGVPNLVHSAAISATWFNVTSDAGTDVTWPAVHYPQLAAIAVWEDGSSARYFGDSQVWLDDTSTTFDGYLAWEVMVFQDDADVLYDGFALITPGASLQRAFSFALPRDARFVDVEANPIGLLLTPPNQDPMWLDLTSDAPGELTIPDPCSEITPNLFLGTANVQEPIFLEAVGSEEGLGDLLP